MVRESRHRVLKRAHRARELAAVALASLGLAAALVSTHGLWVGRPAAGEGVTHDSALTQRQHTAVGPGVNAGRLLVEPDDGRRQLTALLDKAQNTIFMECYILTDATVIRALERAAIQGVEVYVLLERHPVGMGPQPERIADRLKAAGVHVRWSSTAFLLTHAKFLVVDDRIAVVSTANFSHSAFTRNREFLVLVGGAREIRQLSEIFRSDWDHLAAWVADPNLLIAPQNARTNITAFVRRARASVNLYAEEIADPRFEQLLVSLAHRALRVRVILAAGSSTAAALKLEAQGVRVRTLSSPYVHAKLIIVDGQRAFLGSENISTQSLDSNREVGVFLRGGFVRRLRSVFNHDWLKSRPQPA